MKTIYTADTRANIEGANTQIEQEFDKLPPAEQMKVIALCDQLERGVRSRKRGVATIMFGRAQSLELVAKLRYFLEERPKTKK